MFDQAGQQGGANTVFAGRTLDQRLKEGPNWTRWQWAEVRLAQRFDKRVPADVNLGIAQAEAARALGHSFVSSMRYIILPQAVRNAIPALVNHTVSLFKNTSLAMAIGVAELTHVVREVESRSFRTFEIYAVGTAFYLVVSLLLMAAGSALARHYRLAAAR